MKQSKFCYLFILLLIVQFSLLCGAPETAIADTIYVASELGYPPFCIVNEQGEADGFSVEIFREATRAMNITPVFKVGEWSVIKQELADGKIDALPMVGRSPSREMQFDFTFPYHIMHGAVFVRKDAPHFTSVAQLAGKEIIVMSGDNAHEFVVHQNISHEVIAVPSFTEAFQLLSQGHHDAVIAQELMGIQLINTLDINNIEPLPLQLEGFSQDFSFAVTEGNKELLFHLNEGLALIIANGTFDRIYKKWWTPIIQDKLTLREQIKILLPVIIGCIILAAIIFIILLEREIRKRTISLRREIQVHKKTESELHKSEAQFRTLIEFSPIPTFIWKYENGDFLYMGGNPAAASVTGSIEKDFIGLSYQKVFKDRPDLIEKLHLCMDKKSTFSFESDYQLRATKEIKSVQFTFVYISDEQCMMYAEDISHRKNVLLAIQKSEEKYRKLVTQMQQGLAVHEGIFDDTGHMVDYRFIDCNESYEKLTGLKKKEIMGKTVLEILPETEKHWIETYEKIVVSGKPQTFENYSKALQKYYSVLAYRNAENQFAVIISDITEIHHERQALIESEEKFRTLAETTPIAIMMYQGNKWIYTNQAATTLTGYSAEECLTLNFWDFVHPDYRDMVKVAAAKRLKNDNPPQNYEFKINTKDGQEKWVTLTGAMTKRNNIPAVIISVQDITDKKLAEDRLRQSEEQFKFLSAATFEGIIIHKKGIILDANDSFFEMTGYSRRDALGQNILSYIPKLSDRTKVMMNILKKTVKPYTIAAKKKDGSSFIAELEAKDIQHKGTTVRIAAIRDVTERIQAENLIKESRQRFDLVIKGANLGFWDWDVKSGNVIFNTQWAMMLGYTKSEMTGGYELWKKLLHPDDRARVLQCLEDNLQGKTSFYETEYRMKAKNGTWKWILARGKVLERNSENEPLRTLGTQLDISARKEAEELVQGLLKEKEILLKEVHHRIKNNMSTIESLLKIQAQNSGEPSVISALSEANSRLKSMRVLYDKLYRSDNFQNLSIKNYLNHLAVEIIELFPHSGSVKIVQNIDDFMIPAKLSFHLGIVVNELLTNAMKYAFVNSTSPPVITLTASLDGTDATLIVQDNGVGMPAGFDMTTSLGFGMKLVLMLMEQIDGELHLDGGPGTRWILRFSVQLQTHAEIL